MGVKINFRMITKNRAFDPKKGFLTKSISKPLSRVTAMPPAWELIFRVLFHTKIFHDFINLVLFKDETKIQTKMQTDIL